MAHRLRISWIRKRRNQGLASLARLARVAFDLSVCAKSPRRDRLALAMARGMEPGNSRRSRGWSLSLDEVASLLGISKTAVLRRLEAGRLVVWREGRLQAARFPLLQFDRHGRVLAGWRRCSKPSITPSVWMLGGKSYSSCKEAWGTSGRWICCEKAGWQRFRHKYPKSCNLK